MTLGTARWVAMAMYLTALGVYPVVGSLVGGQRAAGAEPMAMLGPAVFLAGLSAYVLSLFLEGKLLTQTPSEPVGEAKVASTAVVVAAIGESLGVFGLVLALLGSSSWAWALYALCAAHGLHLLVRWPGYAAAAEAAR